MFGGRRGVMVGIRVGWAERRLEILVGERTSVRRASIEDEGRVSA
jgi:hypothetical protein